MRADASRKPVCVVVGVGPGNGAAFVRRFAAEGYAVAMMSRGPGFTGDLAKQLADCRPYACDIADPAATVATFAKIEADLGPVRTLIYNAGKGVWGAFDEVSAADMELSWRINTLGAFVAAQCVAPGMKKAGGEMIFVGATASRRGGAKTTAFASAKAAQRSLAESLARKLGPHGVHVALIIIDGVVDEPTVRAQMADRPDSFFVKPDDVADLAVMLTRQKRSAWSFEVEARPFGEKW